MLSIKTKIVKFKSAKLSKEILFKNNSVLQELIRKECTKIAFIYPQGRRPRIPMPRGNFGLPRGKDMIIPCHYED